MREPDRGRARVGVLGQHLKRARQAADYLDPFPGELEKQARDVVAEARAIIEALNRLG